MQTIFHSKHGFECIQYNSVSLTGSLFLSCPLLSSPTMSLPCHIPTVTGVQGGSDLYTFSYFTLLFSVTEPHCGACYWHAMRVRYAVVSN